MSSGGNCKAYGKMRYAGIAPANVLYLNLRTLFLALYLYPMPENLVPIAIRTAYTVPYAQTYIRVLLQVFHLRTTPYIPSGGAPIYATYGQYVHGPPQATSPR